MYNFKYYTFHFKSLEDLIIELYNPEAITGLKFHNNDEVKFALYPYQMRSDGRMCIKYFYNNNLEINIMPSIADKDYDDLHIYINFYFDDNDTYNISLSINYFGFPKLKYYL